MKKILIVIFILLIVPMLSNCKSTKVEPGTFIKPVFPNFQITENNLIAEGIKPQSLVRTYVTLSSEIRLIKDSGLETKQEVKGGGLFIENKRKGSSIYVPLTYDVVWQTGERLQGTPVKGPLEGTNLRSGEIMTGPFMAEVKGIEEGEGYISRWSIQFREDTIGDIFSYKRTPYIPKGFSQSHKSSAGNFQPLRSIKKQVSTKEDNHQNADDYVYLIELLAFEPDMKLNPGYFVEKSTNLVYYDNGKGRFYFTVGASGDYWLVNEINMYHQLSGMYLAKYLKDEQKVKVIDSKILGVED